MNKSDKLKVIYEKIADKTLSFGCLGILKDGKCLARNTGYYSIEPLDDTTRIKKYERQYGANYQMRVITYTTDLEIIGHPVMIGDVLDWIEKNGLLFDGSDIVEKFISEKVEELFTFWKEKRLSIDEQSEGCIDFIYGLCK